MKNSLKYGILIGVISGIWILIMHYSGVFAEYSDEGYNVSWLEYASVLIPATGLYLGIKNYRDRILTDRMEFFEGLSEGFKILIIRDILNQYKTDTRIANLATSLNTGQKKRVHLKGLVGSSDSVIATATYFLLHRHMVFVLPEREEAAYFLSDLENLFEKEILFFPSSFRKSFEFTQIDSSNVLQRAEVLNELNHSSEYGKIIVTYPEALAEKVIDRDALEKNTLEIAVGNKLSIDFINEFLIEYDFERVDFVYEPGQFSIRGGIVNIFSFSHDLPYRVEFFSDYIESIRTFEIEDQLSVEQVFQITEEVSGFFPFRQHKNHVPVQ